MVPSFVVDLKHQVIDGIGTLDLNCDSLVGLNEYLHAWENEVRNVATAANGDVEENGRQRQAR